ncbi:MAG: 3-oxoadipate enol-lactonase [Frankiales bacterium]|nr:3-oxoadipate enol-lactonase [Frankiales bacterium]
MTPGAPAGLHWLVNGSGSPVSLYLPGLGGAIPHLRPLAGGVPGTRVFCELAGLDAPDDYTGLAAAIGRAADACGADRVLGVSLGAGAVLRVLAESPERFARVVIYQPSAFDVAPPERLADLQVYHRLGEAGAVDELAALLNDELPADVRGAHQSQGASHTRAERLSRPEGLRLLKNLAAGEPPLADPSRLGAVTSKVLVVAARDDHVHPVEVAERIAAALPYGELHVFDHPAPLWHARKELRALLSGFLAG